MAQAQFFYQAADAPKPNGPNHIGTCILLEYDGKVLLEHRTDSDIWAVIGGGLKTEERLVEGAIREAFEETGIRLSKKEMEFFRIYDDPSRIASYPDGNVRRIITVVYQVTLAEFPTLVCSEESKELRFFTREDLRSVKIAATHLPIVEDWQQAENR